MTKAQFEKYKQEQFMNRFMDTRRIREVYPDIENIEIDYHLYHCSAFGNQEEERTWNVNMQGQMCFVIDCLNRDCSSAGFDLTNEIYAMHRDHQIERNGEMVCKGQEAYNHPEQSCDGHLEYSIRISYK